MLRLTMVLLGVSFGLVLVSLALGKSIVTDTFTVYQELDPVHSRIYIVDMNRDFQLDLTGTRCFTLLPDWFRMEMDRGYLTAVTFRDDDPITAVQRLNCV